VVSILKGAGYWDSAKSWRLLGDTEGNYSVIGNQQSKPEAALTEKVINSIDARLMCECMLRGVAPTSPKAPQSIRAAVATYFEEGKPGAEHGGTIHRWDNKKRREISEEITVALTGTRRHPCVTISDLGEGQTPDMMPDTFLSIDRQNKLRIPFVQGKFNMGGTGVLEFCGIHNLQMIVSRRHPEISRPMSEIGRHTDYWGFTIVRVQNPPEGAKNSVYAYLAPEGTDQDPKHGGVLRFKADSLPLFPQGNRPYCRDVAWGSAVKLYDYDMRGFASHACMPDGLLYRLGVMIPEPALPMRICECRSFRGHRGSFSTTLTGLAVRLEDNRAANLEHGFPNSVPFKIRGETMVARLYAFKRGKAKTYRANEGIIFTVNGQTHGAIPKSFFTRKNVGMGRIADSLLVLIDCTGISPRTRERLFMNSRDRLRDNVWKRGLEKELEEIIGKHPGLRELKEERKSEEIAEKLDDSKPLEDVLKNILKASPTLSTLLLSGSRLSNPFKQTGSVRPTGGKRGSDGNDGDFAGREHPTVFKFAKRRYGDLYVRACELGRRCRFDFETDVENQYFKRPVNPGRLTVDVAESHIDADRIDWSLTLHNGLAHASIQIPDDFLVGETLTLKFTVDDDVIMESFVNVAKLTVRPKVERPGSGGRNRSRGGTGHDNSGQASGIELPEFYRVHEDEWERHDFDKYSACRVVHETKQGGASDEVYEFYINVDNIYLKTEQKHANEDPRLSEAKFVYGNILLGLALAKDYRDRRAKGADRGDAFVSDPLLSEQFTLEGYVAGTAKAMAPFLLPIINSLGALSENDIPSVAEMGDDE